MVVVLLILGVAAGAVAPALLHDGERGDDVERTAEELGALLRSARHRAVAGGATTILLLDPRSGRYRLEADSVYEGELPRAPAVTLSAGTPRVRYEFAPTGSAWGAPVTVSGAGRQVVVALDPWTGDTRVEGR